MMTFTVRSL